MDIDAANQEFIKRVQASTAVLKDVRPARDVVPDMGERTLLHSGPPIAWDRMCGPMKGAVIGSCLFEGWAKTADDATRLAASGEIKFDCNHHHRAVGPMAGILTPSMAVQVLRNEKFGIETYVALYEGLGRVLRHGVYDEASIERLRWLNGTLGPLLADALKRSGGIDMKSLIAQALQMGDELHSRNRASNYLFIAQIAPHIAATGSRHAEEVLRFIDGCQHFPLNLVMAACKAMMDAGRNIPGSSLVVAMARNGVEFGIQVSGLEGRWFTAPAPRVEGIWFPGFSRDDANPDLGDSAITETSGLGAFAMAAAPAIVQYVGGGDAAFARTTTERMYEITATEHETFRVPLLDFRGTPFGIDIRKVIETGIQPTIDTGVSHKKPNIGQVGAGVTAAPLECFEKALEAFVETI